MALNLLTLLDDSNSKKNKITGEITITTPVIERPDQIIKITSACKINSNCNTKIICSIFEVVSPKVSLSKINFDCQLIASESDNFSISDCTINSSNETKSAFLINQSKDVSIYNIDIFGNSIAGIFIIDGCRINITDSSIHDLKETLIVLRQNSKLIIKKSKIYNSGANGFFVADQSDIEILNCSVINTSYPGASMNDSNCIIKDSEFKKCHQNSVSFSSSSYKFENNIISEGLATGLSTSNSKGTITNNTFTKLEGNGVLCLGYSESEISNNNFFNNKYPSIVIQNKSKAKITNNKIKGDDINGISLRNAVDVTIEKNEIEDVAECGISISDSDKITVKNNTISNCKITAIESYNKSNVFVYQNKISNIGKHAFLSYTSGFMKAIENSIEKVHLSMAKLVFKGSGEFINNKVSGCPIQCECLTSSDYFFNGNGQFKGETNDYTRVTDSITLAKKYVDLNSSSLCLKCHAKPHNCFIQQCGHNVYCKECAELALKNKENSHVSIVFDASSDDTCIICMTNKQNCIIMPCSHMGVCASCLDSWFKNNKCCPICRTEPCFYKKLTNNEI